MNITLCNFRRGVGKSLIAHQLIQGFGLNGVEVDPFGALAKKLPGKVEKIRAGTKLLHTEYTNTVFDFGGFEDAKLYQAVEMSNIILVPFIPTDEALETTRNTIAKINGYNTPILLIANMVHDPSDIDGFKIYFSDVIGHDPLMYHFPLNMAYQSCYNDNVCITDMISTPRGADMAYINAAKSIMDLYTLIENHAQIDENSGMGQLKRA